MSTSSPLQSAGTTLPASPTQEAGMAIRSGTLLRWEIWLLALIPNHLVVGFLGGIGSPALILGVVLLFIWIVSVLTPGIGTARTCVPLRIVIAGFWVIVLISFAAMNVHAVATNQLLNSERFLISLAAFSGVAMTAAEGLEDQRDLLAVLRSLVSAVSVMALIGILQFRPHLDLTKYLAKIPFLTARGDLTNLQARGSFTRPSSTTLHPIEFGVVLGCTLALAIYLALHDRARPAWKRYAPLALIALAIPVSVSRSALLTAGIVLAYFLVGEPTRSRRKGVIAVLGSLVFVFVAIPGMLGTLKGYIFAGNSDSSISHRTQDFAYAAPFVRHHLWVGMGPGSYLAGTFRILDDQFLTTLIELGLIGLFGLAALLLTTTFLGRGVRHRASSEPERNLGQMLAAAGTAAFAACGTFDALSYPTFLAVTALILGLAGAQWQMSRSFNASRPTGRDVPVPIP